MLRRIIPFALLALAAIYLAIKWPTLPDRIPMHYGFSGEADRYAPKSFLAVFLPVIIGTLTCALMAAITWSVDRDIKRRGAINPVFTATSSFLLIVQYYIALVFSAISVIITLSPPKMPTWFFFALIAGVPVLLVVLGIMLNRVRQQPAAPKPPAQYWKWGVFYYNPNDPALWVEKRVGFGYTTNMAHPAAWIVLGSILLFIVAVFLLAALAP